ncbi:unnamed protein product [Urochloa decumbens]|uniref:F-box domain-containing protein n=1 Tax=Urochloa decumbens TaxID=240449 RepID=A0ABC9C5W9_9POAL
MADGGTCLPDDVLVKIFLLIPTYFRRPLRLACKRWRTVIDERAPPEETLPAKILVFINQGRTSSALVFDCSSRHRTRAWTYTSSSGDGGGGSVRMVGTCNGLLCLHDHSTFAGYSSSAVTVTNPATGETVALPPVSPWWACFVKATGHYSFGFHPETKLHKVVYIPRGDRSSLDDALQVFTLGGKAGAWRAVPVPVRGACHDLLCEPVSVAGTTYWLAAGAAGRVMALDLGEGERVTSLDAPPAMAPAPARSASSRDTPPWRLTKVRASLGVVVSSPPGTCRRRVEVWVLDLDLGGGGERPPRWSRRYCVGETVWSSWVMAPQLTHGDCVLSASRDEWDYASSRRRKRTLHRHEASELADGGGDGWQLPPPKGPQLIMSSEEREGELTTFAYVETRNPVPR